MAPHFPMVHSNFFFLFFFADSTFYGVLANEGEGLTYIISLDWESFLERKINNGLFSTF